MHVLALIFSLCLVACGKSNSNAGLPIKEKRVLPLDGSNVKGLYMAKFETLNSHINGVLPGSATLHRQNDNFSAYVRLFGGTPNTWHQQFIHEGGRCANGGDDLNGDGYIDIIESQLVTGGILIPLDANLSSQEAGKNIFPVSDGSGTYFYERVTRFSRMLKDLQLIDQNLEDNIIKIPPSSGLEFEGKTVIIHGISTEAYLPDSVATSGGHRAQQTLPIACGIFKRINQIPGEIETRDGEIPGPMGEATEEELPPTNVPDYGNELEGESDESERWYDRVRDWWRRQWNRDRGNRRDNWGNGVSSIIKEIGGNYWNIVFNYSFSH